VRVSGPLRATKSPKPAQTAKAAAEVCSKLNDKRFAGFKTWHVPTLPELKRFYASSPKAPSLKLWVSNGSVYNPQANTASKMVRANDGQVVCVAK
jgi:hypothetical protein